MSTYTASSTTAGYRVVDFIDVEILSTDSDRTIVATTADQYAVFRVQCDISSSFTVGGATFSTRYRNYHIGPSSTATLAANGSTIRARGIIYENYV